MIVKIVSAVVGIVALFVVATIGVLYWQASGKPNTSGAYVALGSSFAAGYGLGPRVPGTPFVCARSANGYPSLLAAKLNLSLVDMSCSGSTTSHVLKGGQIFLGPQLDAVGPAARLVTITSGGNDVGYIGDLMSAAGKGGFFARILGGPAEPLEKRAFDTVTDNLVQIVQAVQKRAPNAKIAIVSYPAVVPPAGSCQNLGITPEQATLSRQVAGRLRDATRVAAERTGAVFVNMSALSAGHDACAHDPWINGAAPKSGSPFHPNEAGARSVADAVAAAIAK